MLSIRDILWHKQGKSRFPLPEGTRIDNLVIRESQAEGQTSKGTVLQKLFSKIKQKR